MSCQHLVCAVCASPVIEGRCPTCRTSRAHVHRSGVELTSQLVLLLLALVLALGLLAAHLAV